MAMALCVGISGALADVVSLTRDSTISAGLITVGPAPAPVGSSAVDSSADLTHFGTASFTDDFGRDFFASYHASQDVSFTPSAIAGSLVQSADTVLNSPGFPQSRVFSVDMFNHYASSFTVTEQTTLRPMLQYTGTNTTGSAPDRVDFRINTQTGSLFAMPLDLPGGQFVDGFYSADIVFEAGMTYFLVAEARAFSASGDGLISSELTFSLAPVPAPGAAITLVLCGVIASGRRRREDRWDRGPC